MRSSLPGFTLACLLPAILCVSPSAGQPDGKRIRESEVTNLVFSPDGKQLAAVYYTHAQNRPGTDWDSSTVTWDLSTGKPTAIPNGIGPVAFSPDGETLAGGVYDRANPDPGFRSFPYVRAALWRPAAFTIEPIRTLDSEVSLMFALPCGGQGR